MKLKQLLLIVFISATTAVGSIWIYNQITKDNHLVGSAANGLPANYAFFDGKNVSSESLEFTRAANSATPAVVHIRTKIPAKRQSNIQRQRGFFDDWYEDFFGGPNSSPEQRASGSGVLISEDGFIVTNNHVISQGTEGVASEITVTLHNRKTYTAKLVGRDPSSDLAVLKIEGSKFPFLIYGNSNSLQLGQWVLAIGYPLTLDVTVTAGIISATGRSININRRQSDTPIESFIQTDAAVNQGNSGGALVNTNGELVGINSAILAPTGTFAGYSFAIPVNLAKKVVDDIIRHGTVQRGYLGISYFSTDEMSEQQMKAQGIPVTKDGVYVSAVSGDGAASAAGIKKGDVIIRVNGIEVNSGLQMSAQIAGFRPGDRVPITFLRDGKEQTATVVLKAKAGTFQDMIVSNIGTNLGAELENLDRTKARQYGIPGGVVVKSIKEGGPLSKTRISEGFIIVSVNGEEVKSIDEFTRILSNARGPVKLEGIYPGYEGVFTYPLNLNQ